MKEEKLLKIIEWATGDDTGVSSKSLARHMLGFSGKRWGFGPPSDADDRGRCIRLLNLIPEWWSRLDEMAQYPSAEVTCYGKNGFDVKYEGWREQIPLIKKEGGHE